MEYFLQQLINGLTLGAIYGLIAIGYTMVYGIIGMINFAHGDIFMIGGFHALITFLILGFVGVGFLPLALLVALLVIFRRAPLTVPRPAVTGDLTRAIGQSLLTSYVLPFELLGVLFLAALVGALYFARPDD